MKIGIKEDLLIAKLPKIYLLSDTESMANALQVFAREKWVTVNIEHYMLDIVDFCIGYFNTAIDITNVYNIPDNTRQKIKKALFFQMIFEAMSFILQIKELNGDLGVDCKVLEDDLAITIRASLGRKSLDVGKYSSFITTRIAKENNYKVNMEINHRTFSLKLTCT